jgi:hypothetical protein
MNPASEIVGVFKEGLKAYQKYLDTRQGAYNRKMDKKQEKAIRYGELGFGVMNTMFQFIHENMEVPEGKKKEFDGLKTEIYKLKDKFNKYD